LLAVHVTDRMTRAGAVQELFTEYGCSIRTRLGLHEASEGFCSPRGVILLELAGAPGPILELERKLAALEGIEVQKVVFTHP